MYGSVVLFAVIMTPSDLGQGKALSFNGLLVFVKECYTWTATTALTLWNTPVGRYVIVTNPEGIPKSRFDIGASGSETTTPTRTAFSFRTEPDRLSLSRKTKPPGIARCAKGGLPAGASPPLASRLATIGGRQIPVLADWPAGSCGERRFGGQLTDSLFTALGQIRPMCRGNLGLQLTHNI
jgi:hypothetical protein